MHPLKIFKEVVDKKVYVAQNYDTQSFSREYIVLRTDEILHYWPFADDFGPMDMAQITTFVRLIVKILKTDQRKIVYLVEPGKRALANAGILCLNDLVKFSDSI